MPRAPSSSGLAPPVGMPPDDIILGNRRVMTSTEALELEEIPQSLLVIGGGYAEYCIAQANHALPMSTLTMVEAAAVPETFMTVWHNVFERGALKAAFFITAGFMVAEAAGGLLTGSMALLSDSLHMMTDAAALGMSFFASRLASLKPDSSRTYGYRRAEVVAALANAMLLWILSGYMLREVYERFHNPVAVLSGPMLAVAVLGLPANLAGVPGIAFPVGFDEDGLPIGMQLNAPSLGEAALFRAAGAYQTATAWHKERPAL